MGFFGGIALHSYVVGVHIRIVGYFQISRVKRCDLFTLD